MGGGTGVILQVKIIMLVTDGGTGVEWVVVVVMVVDNDLQPLQCGGAL